MDSVEKGKILNILEGIDVLTSEEKKYIRIAELCRHLSWMPDPTVYGQVARATAYGLVSKVKGGGYSGIVVGLTPEGYRFLELSGTPLGKDVPELHSTTPFLTYKQAYKILSNLYIGNSEEKRLLVESIDNLIGEK